jgi:hypothetical protein
MNSFFSRSHDKTDGSCHCEIYPEYSWTVHIARTGLHALRLATAYVLMLVAMTFNAGLFLSILAGASVGFLLTGKKRFTASEFYCH